jgi:hypothetical protein
MAELTGAIIRPIKWLTAMGWLTHVNTVGNATIHVQGSKIALENAIVGSVGSGEHAVPTSDRKWCRLQDSNL